jgi:hypothetical protein
VEFAFGVFLAHFSQDGSGGLSANVRRPADAESSAVVNPPSSGVAGQIGFLRAGISLQ